MKRLSLIALIFILSASIFASDSGYDIMKKARELPEPETVSESAKLTIHSKKGKDRVRSVIMRSKDYGDVEKKVIVFTSPKDVSGVGYLMFDYAEDSDGSKKDSDSWLYMPAMKKTRRIAGSGSDSDNSFMGTDFTYETALRASVEKGVFTQAEVESFPGGLQRWGLVYLSYYSLFGQDAQTGKTLLEQLLDSGAVTQTSVAEALLLVRSPRRV